MFHLTWGARWVKWGPGGITREIAVKFNIHEDSFVWFPNLCSFFLIFIFPFGRKFSKTFIKSWIKMLVRRAQLPLLQPPKWGALNQGEGGWINLLFFSSRLPTRLVELAMLSRLCVSRFWNRFSISYIFCSTRVMKAPDISSEVYFPSLGNSEDTAPKGAWGKNPWVWLLW